ncbi:unnamed protein product [Kuraishia capsulata CBS 1993]|uniref:BZIP domain-containing protein n=1 Tax=Kuraishia capsulata CBS 1993 TaxID=1382522 RepID=W6MSE4_9ASCO|nr:uncharacterized protein KUCA_T00000686001 [Kuraishia capsulata CBS 1993]CDK24720.1 unnamed protein product [Kuraishia capsulata CBS 1993]
MADSKRSKYDEDDEDDVSLKRQDRDSASPTPGHKPGRKPIQTEPKNKRTAQNRAAQRAFRERKERKMKELEMKVELLENEKLQMSNESEFLRIQVESLMNELGRIRGKRSISDVLPKAPIVDTVAKSSSSDISSAASNVSDSPGSDLSSASSATPLSSSNKSTFKFDFPWREKPQQVTGSLALTSRSSKSSVPELAPSTKTFSTASESSPATNGSMEFSATDDTFKSGLDTVEHFDENVDSFCAQLNTACGTKDCPVPKTLDYRSTQPSEFSKANTLTASNNFLNAPSPMALLSDKQTVGGNDLEDPMAFLNNSPFDPMVVFDNNNHNYGSNEFTDLFEDDLFQNDDVVSGLVTEESKYDAFGSLYQESAAVTTANLQNLNQTKVQVPENMDDDLSDNDVVPAEPNLVKCSEIWERITTHPRFSELDIDGLCSELKQKAKCSEKGVVITNRDVAQILDNAHSQRGGESISEPNSFLRV